MSVSHFTESQLKIHQALLNFGTPEDKAVAIMSASQYDWSDTDDTTFERLVTEYAAAIGRLQQFAYNTEMTHETFMKLAVSVSQKITP